MWCGRWRCGVCRGCARAHIRTVNVTVPRATESGTYVVEWACFCVRALIFKPRVKSSSQVAVDLMCRDEVRPAAVNADVASESPIIQPSFDPSTKRLPIRALFLVAPLTHSLSLTHSLFPTIVVGRVRWCRCEERTRAVTRRIPPTQEVVCKRQ